MRAFMYAFIVCILTVGNPARAQNAAVPFVVERTVEGVAIAFPITFRKDTEETYSAIVDLSDALAKVNSVIGLVWARRRLDFDGRLEHRGTLWLLDGASIRFKVHFRAKSKPLPSSNGSIIVSAVPRVAGAAIELDAAASDLRISNTAIAAAVRAWRIDKTIVDGLNEALKSLLAADGARLNLPPALALLGLAPQSAEFALLAQKPVLRIRLGASR